MTKTWKEKIGKRLLKHLQDNGYTTLANFKRTHQWQINNNAPCFKCDEAARKLGIKLS